MRFELTTSKESLFPNFLLSIAKPGTFEVRRLSVERSTRLSYGLILFSKNYQVFINVSEKIDFK